MSQSQEVNPAQAIIQLAMGRWKSHIVGVAAELGLADLLEEGPKNAAEIAAARGLHAPSVYRLMRALAGLGIFAERDDRRFVQTPLSDALRSDVPYSMRGMARMVNRPWQIAAWTQLSHSLASGRTGFEHVHGLKLFDHLSKHPAELQIFADAMSSFSAQIAQVLVEFYDFSGIRTLVDIGGGHGTLLSSVLQKHPALRGILFDLPDVVHGAGALLRERGVDGRVEVVGGNFFERVPSSDAYIMKHILHDWSDEDAARILSSVREAAAPGARLMLVESVLGPSNDPQFGTLIDIEMLVVLGGRERTAEEWRSLLDRTGFQLDRVVPTPSPVSVIEAHRR